MALYKGTIKLDGVESGFLPENSGNIGQVLKKTATGYNWANESGGGGGAYTAGEGINIDANNEISNTLPGPTISSTAPSSPIQGMERYDTTNNKLKVYDGTNWNVVGDDAADVNTKTFYLSNTSDLTTAQAAYDWWNAGKYAIIVYQSESYIYEYYSSIQLKFKKIRVTTIQDSNSVTQFKQDFLYFTLSSGTVTEISVGSYASIARVLSTDINYSSPYTPQYAGSPATKKYVDDNVIQVGATAPSSPTEGMVWYDTTNDVLKSYDGTNWNEIGGGATYTAGTGINIDQNNEISVDATVVATQTDIANFFDKTSDDADDIDDTNSTNKFVTATDKSTWDGKQDAIQDLSTIRSDATAGAGAATTIAGYGDIVSHDANEFATATQGTKADTALQSGDNVSELVNDAGYITNAVNDLANYYKKTETYTQSEINTLISNFGGFEVVATLPVSDIKTNVIYLLGPTGTGADKYEEYIYYNSTWTKIGDTSVDLSNYFNTSTQTSDAITQGSTNLFLTSAERTTLGNTSGVNTGDQSASDFDIKDLADSTGLRTDWSGKQDELIAGTNIQIAADGKTISSTNTTYTAGTGLNLNGTEFAVDSTVVALQSDLSNYYTKTQTYSKTEVDNLISSFGSFTVVATLPSVSSADEKTIYLLGPIGSGVDKYEEWIVTESTGTLSFTGSGSGYTPSQFELSNITTLSYTSSVGSGSEDFVIIDGLQITLAQYCTIDGTTGWRRYDSDTSSYVLIDTTDITLPAGTYNVDYIGYTFDEFVLSTSTKQWTKIGETSVDLSNYLAKNNTTSYTPSGDYNPATKKYVDDSVNVKSFYISGTSDLTTAQSAYEYMSVGTPILRMSSMYNTSPGTLTFFPVKKVNPGDSGTMIFLSTQLSKTTTSGYTMIFQDRVEFTVTNGQVTAITTQFTNSNSALFRLLETNVNYDSTYTPSYNGSPATKKYVDDNVIQKSATAPSSPTQGMVWYDTTNDVLKTYDGTNWNECGGGGDVQVSQQAGNNFTSGMSIWGGSSTDYGNLTPDLNTLYLVS